MKITKADQKKCEQLTCKGKEQLLVRFRKRENDKPCKIILDGKKHCFKSKKRKTLKLMVPDKRVGDCIKKIAKRTSKKNLFVVKTCMCDYYMVLFESTSISAEDSGRVRVSLGQEGSVDLNLNISKIEKNPFKKGCKTDAKNLSKELKKRYKKLKKQGSSASETIKVAIIDSGVFWDSATQEQILNSLWYNPQEIGSASADGDNNCIKGDIIGHDFTASGNPDDLPLDDTGHGMIINEIIAKDYPASNCQLMNLKVLKDGKGDLFDAVCAINYAIAKKAKIINLSWGFYCTHEPKTLRSALLDAKKNGILVITSAGNDGLNTDYCRHWPSSFAAKHEFDNVLSIAAVDESNPSKVVLTSYSNYGKASVNFGATPTYKRTKGEFAPIKVDATSFAAAYVTQFACQLVHELGDLAPSTIIEHLKTHLGNVAVSEIDKLEELSYLDA